MKQFLFTSLAIAALAFAVIIAPSAKSNAASPEIGKAAPDFSATDIEGNPFKLSDHKGDIVVLEWTNHQCPFVVKHYDAEGKLAYEGAIDSNASPNPATIEGAENYVIAAVDSLIAGEEIATAQTQPYGCSVKYAY